MVVYRIRYKHKINDEWHFVVDHDDDDNETIRECDKEIADATRQHLIDDHGVHPSNIEFIEIEDQ